MNIRPSCIEHVSHLEQLSPRRKGYLTELSSNILKVIIGYIIVQIGGLYGIYLKQHSLSSKVVLVFVLITGCGTAIGYVLTSYLRSKLQRLAKVIPIAVLCVLVILFIIGELNYLSS